MRDTGRAGEFTGYPGVCHYLVGAGGVHHEGMTHIRRVRDHDAPLRGRASVVAAAVFGFAVGEAVTAVAAGAASGLSWQRLNNDLVFSNTLIGLVLAVAGWPIARHRPAHPVGWLLLGGGVTWASTGAGIPLLACVAGAGWQNVFWRVVATVVDGGWSWGLTFFLPLALLFMPDGRLPGRRWRLLVAVLVVNGPLLFVIGVLSPPGMSAGVGVPGYLKLHHYDAVRWLPGLSEFLVLLTYLGLLAAMLFRFARGDERVRRQMSWVLFALLVVVVDFMLSPLLPNSLLSVLPIAAIPLSITVAILRNQLFDIRLVFSRSLLYVLLTAAVVGAYLALVTLLGPALRRQIAIGPSLLATLLVALAFHPARTWLQRRVDRAVYGDRRDPVRAMAEVSARLGDFGTTSGPNLSGVLEALCRVLRLPSATITLDGREIATYGNAQPTRHAIALPQGGAHTGELVIGLRPGEPRIQQVDERILDLLAAPIAVALQASTLASELRQTRDRVITGREEERRRLSRDLHDGLGPVLTGVVLTAEAALRLVEPEPQRSKTLIAEVRDQTTAALTDIRRLVYDLRPPVLESIGLVEALHDFANMFSSRADGEPLAVTVDAPATLPDLAAAVEVAAYRIVTEALTNVTRHSNGASATVRLSIDDGHLHVTIHDDGVNLADAWHPGVGLTSIRERVAELGGRYEIRYDRTGGRVDVALPLSISETMPV